MHIMQTRSQAAAAAAAATLAAEDASKSVGKAETQEPGGFFKSFVFINFFCAGKHLSSRVKLIKLGLS